MKSKTAKIVSLTLTVLFLAAAFSACSLITGGETLKVVPKETSVALTVGDTYTIRYTLSDESQTVTFASINTDVITVDSDGVVTAVGKGRGKVNLQVMGITKATVVFDVKYFEPQSVAIGCDGKLHRTEQQAVSFYADVSDRVLDPDCEYVWTITDSANKIKKTSSETTVEFTPETRGETYTVVLKIVFPRKTAATSEPVRFGWYFDVEEVLVAASADTVEYGKSVEFEAIARPDGSGSGNVEFNWYVKAPKGDFEKIRANTVGSFSYEPTVVGEHRFYAEYVASDGERIVSEEASFTVVYAEVANVTVSVDKTKMAVGESANVYFDWNGDYVNPDGTYTLKYYINGVVRDECSAYETTHFVFVAKTAGNYTFKVEINGVFSAEKSVEVVASYPTVHSLVLTVNGAEDNIPLDKNTVSVEFSVENDTGFYDPSAVYSWCVDGKTVAEGADLRTFTLNKTIQADASAEYHVSVKSGKVESRTFTVVQRGETCAIGSEYFEFFTAYGGYLQNLYVTTQEELDNMFSYCRDEALCSSEPLKAYIDYEPTVEIMTSEKTGKVDVAMAAYPESGISPSVSVRTSGSVGEMTFTFDYKNASAASPSLTETKATVSQSDAVAPRYGTGVAETASDNYPNWPGQIRTTNLLYKVLSWGYKPVRENCSQTVWQVYTAARTATANVVSENMSDVEIALAVYDYICYEVSYDFNLANSARTLKESMDYDGYYLEGVFLSKKAVCDGKSKAFVLMASIAGIKSVRATGTAQSSGSSPAGGHAWNKILIENDGDLHWYVCDTTWGDVSVVSGSARKEYLSHKYFLVSDASIASTHTETSDTPTADSSYDFYKNFYLDSAKTVSLSCGNRNDLKAALEYAIKKDLPGVELRISYGFDKIENEIQAIQFSLPMPKTSWLSLGDVYVFAFE